jgi:hypothetical protein
MMIGRAAMVSDSPDLTPPSLAQCDGDVHRQGLLPAPLGSRSIGEVAHAVGLTLSYF